MTTTSDANKFSIFILKCLQACESGSVGGDACRQYELLHAALLDTRNLPTAAARFEHLLGWTAAVNTHQLQALLYRGEPQRNRLLFKTCGDEWKKIFGSNTDAFASAELRSFATWVCGAFQSLLKEAKKEYGDYCNYCFNYMKQSTKPKSSVVTAASGSASAKETKSDDDDVMKPWDMEGFKPMTKSGKQKSPNMIRNELQKYIDACKANGTSTQTKIIERMGVNNNSFRRFMNPKTYKDQWSATNNGTYWAAARLLAEVKYNEELAKKQTKRKSVGGGGAAAKKSKLGANNNCSVSAGASFPSKTSKAEAQALFDKINAVEGVPDDAIIYDTCPQLVAKIKAFLARDGVTKAALLRGLGNLNSNSMNRFLAGKSQDQCASVMYKSAYVFFEKLRLLEGQKKSSARIKNEAEQSGGFSTTKSRGGYWILSKSH